MVLLCNRRGEETNRVVVPDSLVPNGEAGKVRGTADVSRLALGDTMNMCRTQHNLESDKLADETGVIFEGMREGSQGPRQSVFGLRCWSTNGPGDRDDGNCLGPEAGV